MPIKAVFFDMGGTLETYRQTREFRIQNSHWIRESLQKAGIHLNLSDEQLVDLVAEGISKYHLWNLNSMVELSTNEIWSDIVFKEYPQYQKELYEISEDLSFIYETKFYMREMRPEVPEVLEKIKSLGLKIGCISNTQSRTQVPISLREYGIVDYFDSIVLSSEYGRRKPDPSIFYHAARKVFLPTSTCVYVGDKLNRDVLGAQRANYHLAIQIRHRYDDGEEDGGAIPDAIIDDMWELIPILEDEINNKSLMFQCNTKSIKAIFFDAGDILYYRPKKDLNFPKYLKNKVLDPVKGFEKKSKKLKDLAYLGKIHRHEYFEKLIRLYGIKDPAEIAEGIGALRVDEDVVGFFEGVPDTIKKLKNEGYLLAIITDTAMPFSRKLAWFEEQGFGRVWDVVISSKELGIRKPSPEMYQLALSQAGVSAKEAIFVGHKKSELDGARAVGLKTVAFNYDKDAVADVYIDQFCEILNIPLLEN